MKKLIGNSRIRAGLTVMLIALMFGVLMIVNLLTPPSGMIIFTAKG